MQLFKSRQIKMSMRKYIINRYFLIFQNSKQVLIIKVGYSIVYTQTCQSHIKT